MRFYFLVIFFTAAESEKTGVKIKRIFEMLNVQNQKVDFLTKKLENFKTFELSMDELRAINYNLERLEGENLTFSILTWGLRATSRITRIVFNSNK